MPMPPDIDRYRKHVDHFDLTEAQKTDLIHSMHHMMESAVDRAFGGDPTQLCLSRVGSKDASVDGDVINLDQSKYRDLSKTFNTQKGDA